MRVMILKRMVFSQWARRDILILDVARQFMSLNCLAITLTAGIIVKEEQMPSLVGARARDIERERERERVWEGF